MSHVAPHRLADLAAGRMLGRGAARVRVHLDGCERCRQAFERIRSARTAFVEMAGASSPELRWDRIRAQVYWSLGQNRGTSPSTVTSGGAGRRWLAIAGVGLAAATAAAWIGWLRTPARSSSSLSSAARWSDVVAAAAASTGGAPHEVAAAPAPRAQAALVTLIEGDVSRGALASPDEIGATLVHAGDRFTTGDGRVALQLGPASTATLGPRSQLEVRRLDGAMIALAIDGRIDIELEKRAPEQRFVVVSGDRTVEVRGTAFQVVHTGGALAVACEHGRVAVSGGGATVEVGAGQGLRVDDGAPVVAAPVRALAEAELAELAAARPSPLGLWTDAPTMLAMTAPLWLVAPRDRAVRVDGEVIGRGAVWVRKPGDRHLVEVARADGELAGGRWIALDGRPVAPVILADAGAAAAGGSPGNAARRARQAELDRRLDRLRLASCVRALAKQGMAAGTHVELEVGVGASGAIEFLNLADTDLPDRVAGCVRDVVAGTRFAAGPRATWRHRITF